MNATQLLINFISSFNSQYYNPQNLVNYDSQNLLSILEEIIEEFSHDILNKFGDLQTVVQSYMSQNNYSYAGQIIQLIINEAQKYPHYFKKQNNLDKVNWIIDVCLSVMASCSYQIQQTWTHPPDGFDQTVESQQDQITSRMRNAFNRLALTINYSYAIKVSIPRVQAFCASKKNPNGQSDWRAIYSSLFLISQLGETDDPSQQQLHNLVVFAAQQLQNGNPKVRYAALHCLGQLSDDLKPNFQDKYTQQLFPLIVKCIDDSIPRVVSHSFACITNFIQDYNDIPKISSSINKVVQKSKAFLQNPNIPNYIKQNALSAIASLATIHHLFDQDMVATVFKMGKTCLTNFTNDIYKKIRNQSIEMMTILIGTQDQTHIQKFWKQMIQIMIQATNADILEEQYILTSWKRILLKKKKPCDLKILMPLICKISKSLLEKNQGSQIQSAIDIYTTIMESYGYQFKPYAQEVITQIKNILGNEDLSKPLDKSCIQFFTSLAKDLKTQAPDPKWGQIMTSVYKFCSQKAVSYLQSPQFVDFQDLYNLTLALSQMLAEMGMIVDLNMANSIYQSTLSQITKLQEKIKQYNESIELTKEHQKLTEQQQDINNASLTDAKNCRLAFPDIFQSLLKIVPDQTKLQIVKGLLPLIQNALKQVNDPTILRYGFYYICNILDQCSYDLIHNYWIPFHDQFIKYCTHQDSYLRNSVIYGFGILIMKTPNHAVQQKKVNEWLDIIWSSYNCPKYGQSKKQYQFAKDNSVAALGRLLKNFGKSHGLQNVFKQWLNLLPLNCDKQQGNQQQLMLMDIVKYDPGLIIENKDSLMKILSIYGKFVMKRNKGTKFNDILMKTKESLLMMSQWPLFQQNKEYIWNNLEESQRYQLVELSK